MTKEMLDKLQEAQKLLVDVYHYACEHGDSSLASLMRTANDCIIESIEELKNEIL